MWQSLIPLVARYLLATVVSQLPMGEWKAKAKEWVYKQVPGSMVDAAAWRIIDSAWDLILGEVLKQKPQGLASGATMDEAWSSVAHISAAVIPKIEASQAA